MTVIELRDKLDEYVRTGHGDADVLISDSESEYCLEIDWADMPDEAEFTEEELESGIAEAEFGLGSFVIKTSF